MVFGFCYTLLFFVITTLHWIMFKVVIEKEGVNYKNIIDLSTLDPMEYKDTIVAYYRIDPDVISLHEQFGYKMAQEYPYGHVFGTIVFLIWISTIPVFLLFMIWFYWFEKPRMVDPLTRAKMELAKERKNK